MKTDNGLVGFATDRRKDHRCLATIAFRLVATAVDKAGDVTPMPDKRRTAFVLRFLRRRKRRFLPLRFDF